MTPIVTYTLTQQCGNSRPFCRPCTNSFTVKSCGPTHCDAEPPSVICLAPRMSTVECSPSGCDQPQQVILMGFVFSDTLEGGVDGNSGNPSLGLNAIEFGGAAMHVAFDGDWQLRNSEQTPCIWQGQRSVEFNFPGGPASDILAYCGSCIADGFTGNMPCRTVLTCYVTVRLEDGSSPPGLGWKARYAIGFEAYSAEPIYPGGDCPTEAGLLMASGNLWIATSSHIYQTPIVCQGEFEIPVWKATDGTPSILIGEVGSA